MSIDHPKAPPESLATAKKQKDQKAQEEHQEDQESKGLGEALGRLSPEYLVYSDWQQEQGEKTLFNNKEFLEFIKNLNPAFIELFNNLLEQNLEQARKEKKIDIKDQTEIFSEYENKFESLRTNYSLPLTEEEAIATNKENQKIDYAKVKELGLEANIIRGSEAAARLLQEVIDKKIDITTKKVKKPS